MESRNKVIISVAVVLGLALAILGQLGSKSSVHGLEVPLEPVPLASLAPEGSSHRPMEVLAPRRIPLETEGKALPRSNDCIFSIVCGA